MDKKRFKKQELKSEDYKGMEQGAKAVKGLNGLGAVVGVLVKSKDNLKTLGNGVVNLASICWLRLRIRARKSWLPII